MGTTQSKKRRKDKQPKRGSISQDDMPRSSSMDSLRPSGLSSSSSACPGYPHGRSSLSWSSDHSLTPSACMHRYGRRGDTQDGDGEGGEMWGSGQFESCQDCYLPPSTSTDCLRLCEISNQDYDEISCTMSLNRYPSGRPGGKPGGIAQSKSVEFSEYENIKQNPKPHSTKENVNPAALRDSDSQLTCPTPKTTAVTSRPSSSGKPYHRRRPPSSHPPSIQHDTNLLAPPDPSSASASSHSAPQLPPPPPPSHSRDAQRKGETKSNNSLLEDEEAIMSRWVKRKQMAQELRNLRMHLQSKEVNDKRTNVPQSSSADIQKVSTINNNNVETEETFVKEARQPTTAAQSAKNEVNVLTADDDNSTDVNGQDCSSTDVHDDANDNQASTESTTATTTTTTTSPTRRSIRSKFSRLSNYRFLDNHPVMTRLQNEQNNRLELMERRMEEIRVSAMQEAQRRKFAEIFPAKDDDTETQKLLREARESLERMKDEKRKKALSSSGEYPHCAQHTTNSSSSSSGETNNIPRRQRNADSRSDDSGEIIPVHVVSSSREVTPASARSQTKASTTATTSPVKKGESVNQSVWLKGEWPDINLGQPLTWLWLPFLLFPVVLRMLVAMIINSLPAAVTPRGGSGGDGSSASTTGGCASPADRGQRSNLSSSSSSSRSRRKKSC